ncbi:LysR family transcriptional regulator [Moritella viscosa]|uniref:LysR family transcriptional regulator n=1 Tax=Moritella viscosa TaxID=80854 RepID=A0A1L0F2F5_9GAMM|nr:LysR family transcriptional regulator [Moritella viscosa]SGZ01338.1 LysR family transcriptional regulator [Moritella viscosa]SGZ06388.1 LysR family transcriptional regulator [Moritella viscosa]SGZ07963.1 LysR family transcriptional regulator [Moritella viscosa]SGZ15508.1 LysR family transcriptional regulator [Moritella viscosa]SGZ18914.1 LysR family transcriptional regulator [Moritella viscosa]
MINKVNLADIRSFVLIAKLGNFTKAAEALSVSRSHVSRQISSLEKQMQVTLFTRSTRSLKLTQAGERLYQECEKSINGINQALIAAVDDTEEIRGLIRVNCVGGYIGENIISKYLADFMVEYQHIQVHLDFSSHRIDLIQDDFDVAFRMGQLEDSGFIAKKLMNIEIVTLASPSYIKQYGSPEHPKELNEHRCLTGSVKRWSFQSVEDKDEQFDVSVEGHLVTKNGYALITNALTGNGIIRVPRMYCSDAIRDGRLVEILPQWHTPSVLFSAVYHRDKYQPKRLRTFIDFIKQRFEGDLY